ncbi:MAG: hypothetical protein HQK78_12325 [Desulfobacterales bacterium]|nr:hypothetical protein [Desulfobacterales bacterium]
MKIETTEERKAQHSADKFFIGVLFIAAAVVWIYSILKPPSGASLMDVSGTVTNIRESKIGETEVYSLHFSLSGYELKLVYEQHLPNFQHVRDKLAEGVHVRMIVKKPPSSEIWHIEIDNELIADMERFQAARRGQLRYALVLGILGVILIVIWLIGDRKDT